MKGLLACAWVAAHSLGWKDNPPADVTARCQRLARMSRFYPVACKEEYSLGADGSVRVRQSFEYLEIKDDWDTRGAKVAPLPPAFGIALASASKGPLPVQATPAPDDLSYPTVNGPLLVCQGDGHVVRIDGARKYIDERRRPEAMVSPVPARREATIGGQPRGW